MTNEDDTELKEFVEALQRIGVEQIAGRLGVPRDDAADVMRQITEQVCWQYARRQIYVPVAYDPRNRQIYDLYHRQGRASRACTPGRVRELAADFQLTERQIYYIIKTVRDADMASRQGVLPGLEHPTDQAC